MDSLTYSLIPVKLATDEMFDSCGIPTNSRLQELPLVEQLITIFDTFPESATNSIIRALAEDYWATNEWIRAINKMAKLVHLRYISNRNLRELIITIHSTAKTLLNQSKEVYGILK